MVSQPGSAALTYSPCARCRLGLIGDLGQTENSAQTLEHLAATRPASVINVGDLSYADGMSPSPPLPPTRPAPARCPQARVAGRVNWLVLRLYYIHSFACFVSRAFLN